MPKGNPLLFFTVGGLIAVALLVGVLLLLQPGGLRNCYVHGATNAKASDWPPAYEGSVTCNANCQVRFAIGDDPHSASGSKQAQESAPEQRSGARSLEQQDLLAQCRMAFWAVALAGLTAVGIVLLAGTFWEAMEATRAANAAADAARMQARAAFSAGRAYLHPSSPSVAPMAPNKRDEPIDVHMGFWAAVENRGSGLGFLWRLALGHEVTPHGTQPEGNNVRISDYLSRTQIGPGGIWKTETAALLNFKLTDQEIDRVMNGNGQYLLHIFGYFEYEDIHGLQRQTGFHFSYIPHSMELIMERAPRLWFDRVVDPPAER